MIVPNITLENLVKELLKEEIFLKGLYSALGKTSSKEALTSKNIKDYKKDSFIFGPNVSIRELAIMLVNLDSFDAKIMQYLAVTKAVTSNKLSNDPPSSVSNPPKKRNCGCSSVNNKY